MQSSKFLGVSILISAVVLSTAVVVHGKLAAPASAIGRYQFHPSTPPGVLWVIDTTTGEVNGK
ncbi:MAG: hypothetical protein ACM3U2_01680, partial [Deltaproteobacteria bacterium]